MALLIESDEPEEAWRRAQRTGVLVLSHFVTDDDEEWLALIDRWQAACHAARRASIVAFVNHRGLASVCFDGKGLPCFTSARLDAAMGRLLADTVDGNGFADGAFATWQTRRLPLAKAGRVATQAMWLERFSRDPAGAGAFDAGGDQVLVWEVDNL